MAEECDLELQIPAHELVRQMLSHEVLTLLLNLEIMISTLQRALAEKHGKKRKKSAIDAVANLKSSISSSRSDIDELNDYLQEPELSSSQTPFLENEKVSTVVERLINNCDQLRRNSSSFINSFNKIDDDIYVIASKVHRVALRAADLIRLSLGLFSAGGSNPFNRFRWDAILADVLSSIPEADRSKISVEGTGRQGASGSKEMMFSVILNILRNSLSYQSPDRQLEIRISVRTYSTEEGDQPRNASVTGRWWSEVTVSDNGRGIPENVARKVFEPGIRLNRAGQPMHASEFENCSDGTTSSSNLSFGLGLSLVRKIVEYHEGKTTIEPNHPHGTKVVVTIPERR